MEKSISLFQIEEMNFDFNHLKNANVETITGIPVKVDKVIYDLTGTTAIGVGGTMTIKGIKLRGVWDSMGNPLDFKKVLSLNIRNNFIDISSMLSGYESQYFRLVRTEPIEIEDVKNS